MARQFEYTQAEEIRNAFNRHGVVASKAASNRAKDREVLARLRSFRDYWLSRR